MYFFSTMIKFPIHNSSIQHQSALFARVLRLCALSSATLVSSSFSRCSFFSTLNILKSELGKIYRDIHIERTSDFTARKKVQAKNIVPAKNRETKKNEADRFTNRDGSGRERLSRVPASYRKLLIYK